MVKQPKRQKPKRVKENMKRPFMALHYRGNTLLWQRNYKHFDTAILRAPGVFFMTAKPGDVLEIAHPLAGQLASGKMRVGKKFHMEADPDLVEAYWAMMKEEGRKA